MPKKPSKKLTTFFQRKVYEVVRKIPKGKVLSYSEVAKLAGFSRAWRAVGNILNKNQNPKIPCHRIIKSDGRAGGYKKGTSQKISLLKKEGIFIKNGKITSRVNN
jgi:O-6-methylguanine DNA methyltransferase